MSKLTYRPEIDGLRAIAVLSVLIYHAQFFFLGRVWFKGGFVGVDIFFIISGYLITRIILNEYHVNKQFNLLHFYERRARRILPMLIFVIAVCIPFAWEYLIPNALIDFAKSSLSTIGFFSNVFFYFSTTEYGANSSLAKPLLHTWSLGVEEQFYIIAPFLIILICKYFKEFQVTIILGLLLLSLQFADTMAEVNPELNFYLPFSRFWEFFLGSILAFVELKFGKSKNNLAIQILPIFGLFLIIQSILFFNLYTPHPSFKTLLPAIGVSLIIFFSTSNDLVGKLLSTRLFVGVGLISYSLYLWHFPIFAFNRQSILNHSNFEKIEWFALTLFLSVMSYFIVERPFRNRQIISFKIFLSSVLLTIICLTVINLNFIKNDGYPNRLPEIFHTSIKRYETFMPIQRKINDKNCHKREQDFCSSIVSEDNTYVYSFGDSFMSSLSLGLETATNNHKLNFVEANWDGCPFALNINKIINNRHVNSECHPKFQNDRLRAIVKKPSIILIGGRYPLYLENTPFDNLETGKEIEDNHFFRGVDGRKFEDMFIVTLKALIKRGHKVILIYPFPEVGVNVPKYLFNKLNKNKISEVSNYLPLTTSFDVFKSRSQSTFKLFDSIQSSNIHRVYPHKLFCNKQIISRCVTHTNKKIYYSDDDHPSSEAAEIIIPSIMTVVKLAEKQIRNKN